MATSFFGAYMMRCLSLWFASISFKPLKPFIYPAVAGIGSGRVYKGKLSKRSQHLLYLYFQGMSRSSCIDEPFVISFVFGFLRTFSYQPLCVCVCLARMRDCQYPAIRRAAGPLYVSDKWQTQTQSDLVHWTWIYCSFLCCWKMEKLCRFAQLIRSSLSLLSIFPARYFSHLQL